MTGEFDQVRHTTDGLKTFCLDREMTDHINLFILFWGRLKRFKSKHRNIYEKISF